MTEPAALILVVEDETPMRKFLESTLASHCYRVVSSANGRDAIVQARTRNPDVVLLDLGLPDVDGLEITKQLRSFTTAPIIVVSARGQEADKIAALDLGANDYLTKPFSVGELLARIRVAMRALARVGLEPNPGPFVLGELLIDLTGRKVTRNGEPIHLAPMEFKLLSVLVRSAGKVITRKQLLHDTWGAAYEKHGLYLRVYMHALRHKLERDPARPRYLVNEPGIGYRLNDKP